MNDKFKSLKGILSQLPQTFFKLIIDFKELASAEARLAMKSVAIIIVLSLIFRAFLLTTWVTLCALIVAYLISLHFSLISSLWVIAVLNFVIVVIAAVIISQLKGNLKFAATRRQLKSLTAFNKDASNEKFTNENQIL